MKIPKKLEDQRKLVDGKIKDEGDGYFSMIGKSPAFNNPLLAGFIQGGNGEVAYIFLPKNHPDIGKSEENVDAPVNGGWTLVDGRLFGWDYGHSHNYGTPEEDIKEALKFFKAREK